jgi:hypothetical protein
MVERFTHCVQPFVEILTRFKSDLETYKKKKPNELYTLCCALKAALMDLLANHAAHNCTLLERMVALDCPQPGVIRSYLEVFEERLQVMVAVWYSGLLDCYCRALLPPCETAEDPRVVLGKVTVRRKECKVLRVCNWIVERKFANTFPNLQYWLSWLPYGRLLRSILEQMCCDLPKWITSVLDHLTLAAEDTEVFRASSLRSFATVAPPAAEAKGAGEFAGIVAETLLGKTAKVDPQSLFMGLAGLSDADGKPIMNQLERENLLPSLLMKHLGASMLQSSTPADISSIAELAGRFSAAATPSTEIEELKAALEEMKSTIARQKDRINGLEAHLSQKK